MKPDRVIFVDDDADLRAAIGQSLDLAGYRVTLCRAFIEAIDHLTRGFSGVVVTDVRMPGRDG
ncbi:MAG: response regulator, partial [Pseudomonadota bacterium]